MRPTTIAVGGAVLTTIFVLGPIAMIGVNQMLGWPRWHLPAGHTIGGILILAALGLSAHCSRVFDRLGKGTPVPIEPPKHLVVAGLYRRTRNPMYIAHLAMLLGLFLVRGELVLYVLFYAGLLHVWVVRHEEPNLVARFGDEYRRYRQRVAMIVPFFGKS